MKHLKLYEFFINDRQTLNNKIPKTDDYIVIISIEEYYVSTEIDNFLKSHVGKVIKMINAETCRIKYDEKCSENDLTAIYLMIFLIMYGYLKLNMNFLIIKMMLKNF